MSDRFAENHFVRQLAMADTETFDTLVRRMYRFIKADTDPDRLTKEDPEDLFDALLELRMNMSPLDRAGLRAVMDDAFAGLIGRIEAMPDPLADEVAFGLRELRHIVTGRAAFDGAPYTIFVVGPDPDEEDYRKPSPFMRASELQRRHRLSVQPLRSKGDLNKAQAVLFEVPLSTREVMLAGEARGLGLEIALIGREEALPGVPTFATADEAFLHLQARVHADRPEDHDPHAEPPSPDLPGGGSAAAWRLRAEILEQAYAALRRSAIFSSDRGASRSAAIDTMIRGDDVPEAVKKKYFDIVANGSTEGVEPVLAWKINGMRHRIEELETQLAKNIGDEPDISP